MGGCISWARRGSPGNDRLAPANACRAQEGRPDPIFAARTREPAYGLAEAALPRFFAPGHRHSWRVRALSEAEAVVGDSERRSISFR